MNLNIEKIENILNSFVSNHSYIEGVILATPEGCPLASILPELMDEEDISAMSAVMLALGKTLGSRLYRGKIDSFYLSGDRGFGLLTNCGENAIFLVLANCNSKQEILLLEIAKIVPQLKYLIHDLEAEKSYNDRVQQLENLLQI